VTTIATQSQQPVGTASTESVQRTGILTVLLVGQFMALLDLFVVNVALPAIRADLHSSGTSLQLVVGGYSSTYAVLLITGARLGDLYGRRRMYLIGVLTFTTASLVCGLAPNSAVLIAFRFVQGGGSAMMVPQIMSVIQMHFTGTARAKALSTYGAVLSAGMVAGLVVGGVVINADFFGATWRPVFLINVPLGVGVALLVPRLVPADAPRSSRKLDLRGLAIAVPALCLVVLPLVLGHELRWPAWTFVSIFAGLALLAIFVIAERRIAARNGDPLLDLGVLRCAGLTSGLVALVCMQIAAGGFLFTFTLHLEAGLGYSALRTGLTYLPMAAPFGLISFYWRRLPHRLHPIVVPVGMGLTALGYLGMALALHHTDDGGAAMWICLVTVGVGMGLSASPLLTQALAHVPMPRAADAGGLLTTAMQLSQLMGVATLGTLFLTLRNGALDQAAHTSASAMTSTAFWLSLVSALGLAAAATLTHSQLQSANGRVPCESLRGGPAGPPRRRRARRRSSP
jgi:EmrB/QacA subfamily drug resistance transporter